MTLKRTFFFAVHLLEVAAAQNSNSRAFARQQPGIGLRCGLASGWCERAQAKWRCAYRLNGSEVRKGLYEALLRRGCGQRVQVEAACGAALHGILQLRPTRVTVHWSMNVTWSTVNEMLS